MPVLEVFPELIDLGIAVGLMQVHTGRDLESATLNDDFFGRPDHYLAGVLTQASQREALLRIAGRMANPDGMPVVSSDGEQWIPLAGSAENGLYLVTLTSTPVPVSC